MEEQQLYPVFELPKAPERKNFDEIFRPSAYFDFENGDFLRDGAGKIITANGHDAFLQWCIKVVETERLSCDAYSDSIGTEFESLYGKNNARYVKSEIQRTIHDAIMVHPAAESVSDFKFAQSGDSVWVAFTVKGKPWLNGDRIKAKL